MKTKQLTVRIGHKLGLPNFSSMTVEVEETVELEDEDSRKEALETAYRRLEKFVNTKVDEADKAKNRKSKK